MLAEGLDAPVVTLAALPDFDDVEEDLSEHQTLKEKGRKAGIKRVKTEREECISPMMIMKAQETMRMMVSVCMIAILLPSLSCCNDGVGRNVDAVAVAVGEGWKWLPPMRWLPPPP